MANTTEYELEVFLAESIGLQLANLRYHLALCASNDGPDQRALTKEEFSRIEALMEMLARKAERLREELEQQAAPRGVDRDVRYGTAALNGTSSVSRRGPGIASVLERLGSS